MTPTSRSRYRERTRSTIVSQANDIVNSYSKIFKGRKSDKEILYMSLLDIALRYEKESGRNDTAPYHDILTRLTAEIEDTLK